MMKKVFLIAMCLLILCCTACSVEGDQQNSPPTEKTVQQPVQQQVQQKNLPIYRLHREEFEEFLGNPSCDFLAQEQFLHANFPQYGDWYITMEVRRFPINHDLISFVNDLNALQQFLKEHGHSKTICRAVLYDTPKIPLTICAQADDDTMYMITVNEFARDELYVYRLYTFSEYKQKYGGEAASLFVNGSLIGSGLPITIYHGYADVPFIEVLSALGATVSYDDDTVKIRSDNGIYLLDVQQRVLISENEKDSMDEPDNLLLRMVAGGGAAFVYSVDGLFMVDTVNLREVLEILGYTVDIDCDKDTKEIRIEQVYE